MKINISKGGKTGTIETRHDDPDSGVIAQVSGELAQEVRLALEGSSGHYGHLLNLSGTTNLDLQSAAIALRSKGYVVTIEPEIKANPLPAGVQS